MSLPDHLIKPADYARFRGRDLSTVYNWIREGYFPVYRARGSRSVLIDLDEAEAALAKLPPSKVGRAYGTFGPKAKVIDLTKVVE